MIKVFYGDDRVKAQAEIRKVLGEGYEVVDGEELTLPGLIDVMAGTSLFGKRKIVVKDLAQNKELFAEVLQHLGTENDVVLWESRLDKRTALYKDFVQAGVEMREFKLVQPDTRKVFDIYETALRDGPRAVKMCEEIETENDPYMFVGLMVAQAVKKWSFRYGEKEKRALRELSKLDMQMKGDSAISEPWTLVKAFLLRASSL